MGLYQYTALTKEGRKNISMINAESLELAKERLRNKKILVTKITQYKKQGDKFTISSPLLLDFTRDLHILLKAGLPFYDCLLILEEKYRKSKMHSLFLDLCDQVKQGCRFSDALKEYPKIFDPVYLSIIRAGEESGTLTESFGELAKLTQREQSLKKKLSCALIYPTFLGVFCIGVIGVLLFFLIPSMAEIFEGRSLHPITHLILSISQTLNQNFSLIIAFFIGGIFFLILFFHYYSKGKEKVKELLISIPVIKRIFIEVVMSRFCRVFSVLFYGGVPMLECLRLSKKVMKHPSLEQVISKVEVKIMEGKRLSDELRKSTLIPPLVVRMLSIAEDSGRIAEMMGQISNIYEENIGRSLSRLTAFLQPVMLLLLGIIVAVILLAVLLPLTDASSFMQ